MYCHHCGVKASGNFCSSCGARLASPETPAPSLPLSVAWEDEVRYDLLIQCPGVRERLARHAAQARKGLSGEAFLQICDKLFEPIAGIPVAKVASIAAPILDRAGIRTGKTRKEVLPRRLGEVLVAALCSLAQHGQALKQVHQGEDGCVLEAAIPSDVWSFEGKLILSVQRRQEQTRVEAATTIPGQLFDWGKSTRCLERLFADLESPPA